MSHSQQQLEDIIFTIWESKMHLMTWMQGKLVGWLDVPEWIVMTSKGGTTERMLHC